MSRASIMGLALVLSVATACSSDSGTRAPCERAQVADEECRELIFHGMNIASGAKWPPDFLAAITEDDAERMVNEWGYNFVRYLVSWAPLEPEPGVFDEAYLDAVEQQIEWFTSRGAYVLIDMHQDVYGFGAGGNGAPVWATETDGLDFVEFPPGSPWWLGNLQPPTIAAWENFWAYDRFKYLQDHQIMAWQHVARRFGNSGGLIGFELMNEPFPGALLPSLTGAFEPTWLADYYARVIPALRAIDNDAYIFFEPMAGQGTAGWPSNLPTPEDPRDGTPRLVYSAHLYPPVMESSGEYAAIDRAMVLAWGSSREREMQRHRTSLLVSELGGPDSWTDFDRYLDDAMTMIDALGGGWAWWTYGRGGWGPLDADGNDTPKLHHLVRTYPRAVAGAVQGFSFDAESGAFSLTFTDDGARGPTEIFVAERHYANGWTVELSDADGSWRSEYDDATQLLQVWTPRTGASHTIRVLPRDA